MADNVHCNVTPTSPVRSIAVGCSSPAVVPLLRILLSVLLRTPQQRLQMLFSRLAGQPPTLLLPVGRPSWFHLIHGSLDPWVSHQTASGSVQPFLHSTCSLKILDGLRSGSSLSVLFLHYYLLLWLLVGIDVTSDPMAKVDCMENISVSSSVDWPKMRRDDVIYH